MKPGTRCIIGIVGLPGAGKTTVASHIVKKKFAHVILSDFVKEEIIRQGLTDFSRTTYQRIANQLREHIGGYALAELAIQKIRKERLFLAVIDGIRNVEEIAYLRKQKGFHLLGVSASARIRFKRLSNRLKSDKQLHRSYAQFLKEEKGENTLGSKKTGLRVKDSLKEADVIIKNDKGRKALFNSIDTVLQKWQSEV